MSPGWHSAGRGLRVGVRAGRGRRRPRALPGAVSMYTWPSAPGASRTQASAPDAIADGSAFDVLVLGGAAGGMVAAITVLRDLPRQFRVPVLLMLHLPPASDMVSFFAHLPFHVDWIHPGVR